MCSDLKTRKGDRTQTDNEQHNIGTCTSDDHEDIYKMLSDLLPDVCEFLTGVDAIHSTRLIQYMRLLSNEIF